MTRGQGWPDLCNLGLMVDTPAPEHSTRSVFLDKAHPAAWRALNGLGLKAKEAA